MERIQKDVTQTMREILVDWLVEVSFNSNFVCLLSFAVSFMCFSQVKFFFQVSEEYTLVPDTLYLTVYLIDWFLHGNYMERQRLQLLGITCMLIAS